VIEKALEQSEAFFLFKPKSIGVQLEVNKHSRTLPLD
jgi:hypothetical protein